MEPKGEIAARFREGTFLVGVQGPLSTKNRFARNEAALTERQIHRRIQEMSRQRDAASDTAPLRIELVRRWAVPLVCVLFAILGVPLAVAMRGARGSAYLITLGVFVAFYALSRFAIALASGGMNPWLAGFLPDLVLLALASAYTLRLLRSGVGKPS